MTERLVRIAITPAWLACVAGWAILVAAHNVAETIYPFIEDNAS